MSEIRGIVLKGFLNSLLKEIMSAVNAECGSLFLFDSEHEELVLDSFYNSDNLHLEGLRRRIGEGIAGKVVDAKAPILVKDINSDLRFKRNGFNHYKTNSFISIPLFTSGGMLGLINLADKSSGEPFSEKDLEFAVSLSGYACVITDLEKYASVGKLAAGIVHEINNPLDGVIRYTNILLSQMDSNSIAREYLLEIKKGLSRIANITKSLLEFSHLVNSNSSLGKEYADVYKIIDESLEFLKDRINNIKINKRYEKSLPLVLNIGLEHVFINIIKNALDAMPEGGILDISTALRDSIVEINIKDTGQGIADEIRERIFEPFFTTKAIDKGTGLGLSICREIIDKYEGKIEVRSSPKEGSTFTVIIPKKYLQNA